MQPLQCDLQPQLQETHRTTPQVQPLVAKHIEGTNRVRNDRSRTRRTHEVPFIVACSHFTRKNTSFVLRLPPQNIAHATFMQPLQCDQQPQLQETHRTTHTRTSTCCKTHRRNQSRPERPQPHPSHTRGTFHRRLQPLYTEKHKVSCSSFPSSPLLFVTTPLHHHFHSSPLPFLTTSHRHRFPSSPLPFLTTPLHHHFPSSPLPFVTTSHRHHFPSSPLPFLTTSLPHHFPSSPLPFLTTSLPHHSPSSSLSFVTTSLRHHFPSSPLPFVTTSLRHHFPSSPTPLISTLHQSQFHCFLFFCYVLLCYVLLCDLPPCIISSRRILFVRNTEVLLPNFLWIIPTD